MNIQPPIPIVLLYHCKPASHPPSLPLDTRNESFHKGQKVGCYIKKQYAIDIAVIKHPVVSGLLLLLFICKRPSSIRKNNGCE